MLDSNLQPLSKSKCSIRWLFIFNFWNVWQLQYNQFLKMISSVAFWQMIVSRWLLFCSQKNRTFGNIGCKICEHMPLPCWFFDSIIIGWSDSNSNNWFSCQMPWKHSMGCFCPGISILCWDTWIARTIKAPFCNSHALNRCAPNMFVRLNRGLTLEHFFLSKTVHHTRSAVLHFCSQWCLILRSSYRSFHS